MLHRAIEMVPLSDESRKKQILIDKLNFEEYCFMKFNKKITMIMKIISFIFSLFDKYGNIILEPQPLFLSKLKDIIVKPKVLLDCDICDCIHGKELDKLHSLLAMHWNNYLNYKDIDSLNEIRKKLILKKV